METISLAERDKRKAAALDLNLCGRQQPGHDHSELRCCAVVVIIAVTSQSLPSASQKGILDFLVPAFCVSTQHHTHRFFGRFTLDAFRTDPCICLAVYT